MNTFERSNLDKENAEEATSRVVVHIFRHSEAAHAQVDEDRRLTPRGAQLALERSANFKMGEGIDQSVALGSPRRRAQETAVLVMGGPAEFTGEETLEELRAKIDEGVAYGSKLGIDQRLNFVTATPEYTAAMTEAYNNGRTLDFMVKESDELARSLGDAESSTYSRTASRFAELVKRYREIAPRFNTLVETKGYGSSMERFLGTHQTMGESFLLKVVEKLKGVEERDRLAGLLGGGFDLVEGFDIEIRSIAGKEKPEISVHYSKNDKDGNEIYRLDEALPDEVLDGIYTDERR